MAIHYDPDLNTAAGYLSISDDTAHGAMRPGDRKTLVHLLFAALYTFEGREKMRNNKAVGGVLDDVKRQTLIDWFATYNVTNTGLVQAILDAHVAAENYAFASKHPTPGSPQAMAENEKVYLQKMSFICWQLWEDAKDHEFSLGW